MVAAARYRSDQPSLAFGRQLIGPALFPAYLCVLGISIGIAVVVIVLVAVALASGVGAGSVLPSIPLAILIQFVAVTAIFIVADRTMADDQPKPVFGATLAAAEPGTDSVLDRLSVQLIGGSHPQVVPRRTSASDLALLVITFGWLVAVRPPIVLGVVTSGPGWETSYTPILIVLAAATLQPIVNLLRPEWAQFRQAVRVLVDLALLGFFGLSVSAGAWIVPADGATVTQSQLTTIANINRGIGFALGITMTLVIVMILLELRRLVIQRHVAAPIQGRTV